MRRVLLRNGFVVDPANGVASRQDILLEGDTIGMVDDEVVSKPGDTVVDCSGMCVMPGFVDLQVNPGSGIEASSRSMLMAGVTTPLFMACNTYKGPTLLDEYGGPAGLVKACHGLSSDAALAIPVEPPDTAGHETYEQLATPLDRIPQRVEELVELGVTAVGEVVLPLGGLAHASSCLSEETLDTLLDSTSRVGIPVLVHTGLGLHGIREAVRVANGRPMHLCHVGSTCAGDSIHAALALLEASSNVTSDTHLSEVAGTTSRRSQLMLDALRRGEVFKVDPASLQATRVSALADCVPPFYYRKRNLFVNNVICALSDAVHAIESDDLGDGVRASIMFRNLMNLAGFSLIEDQRAEMLVRLIAKVTVNPARVLGIDAGTLSCGARANVVVADPVKPQVKHVLVGGEFVVRDGRLTGRRPGRLVPRRR